MSLPEARPSDVGVDAGGVEAFLDAAAHLDLHSLAIARQGRVIARGWWAPYAPDRLHLMYSISKSVTASTVALLVADGTLGLDDPIVSHLPLEGLDAGAGPVDPVWERVTVRHCLTMTVGHTQDAWRPEDRRAAPGTDLLARALSRPPDAEPGSVFCYNQVATYLLGRAVAHRSGEALPDVVRRRLFAPLGITDLEWHRDGQGHALGFSGAHLRTDDLLRLAQLWLDRGRYEGGRLLPDAWFDEATVPALAPPDPDGTDDWGRGYGFSYWIARHGYRGDGAYGQYALVLPEQQLAVAVTSELDDMGELLDLLWTHLLPAAGGGGSPEADARLAERLASLTTPTVATTVEPPAAAGAWELAAGAGTPPGWTRARVEEPRPGPSGAADEPRTLVLVRGGQEHRVSVGDGRWADSTLAADGAALPVSATGGWTAAGFEAHVRVVETPHSLRFLGPASGPATLTWRLMPLHGPDPFAVAVRRS